MQLYGHTVPNLLATLLHPSFYLMLKGRISKEEEYLKRLLTFCHALWDFPFVPLFQPSHMPERSPFFPKFYPHFKTS